MSAWSNFFLAEAGASAALAGLIFVGISINLEKILSFKILPDRGGQALMLLLTIVIVSSMMLIPGEATRAAGIEVLVVGLIVWWSFTRIDLRARKSVNPDYRRQVIGNMVLNQVATLLYVAGGVALLVGGVAGIYWLVPAVVFSMLKAMSDAWVLLVEINR